ncbi:MAG: hypothetical protein WBB02_12695 [Saprospiraceae bacterium]
MEGKYTITSTIVGLLALIVTIWQLYPKTDKKINGEWIMISKINEADLKEYLGLEIQWKLFLTEKDQIIKGKAEKVTINNEKLNYDLRTSMDIEGNLKDDVLTLNYTEYGKRRNTTGIIIATLNDKGFVGQFSQTASNTRGEIKGIKNEK